MNFVRTFLASLLALTVFTVLSFLMFIIVLIALGSEEKVTVTSNSILHLKLDAQITEQHVESPFGNLPVFGEAPTIGLLKLKETIRHAKTDPKIRGIFLNVNYPMAGFSSLAEIRESLIDFREEGKWVVAYSEVMSEPAYYVASAADKVYLNPTGEIDFNGLTVEIGFFKRLLDKLDIKPEIFRVGDFKSAVEPYILEKMSSENQTQLKELINSIYNTVLQDISETRNVPSARLREISDKMLVRNADQAVEYGLVDSLLYYDEVLAELRHRLAIDEKTRIKLIRMNRYARSISSKRSAADEIAVIVAEGTILPGSARQQVIGSDTFAEEIRKARLNKKVKAIVIRVNSPGGAFQASDVIWREIAVASREKPVIASMSDYAASGGYYLAMACDTIVAQPHTITGSIGVFSVLFDASGFLGNKLGITFDEVSTGDFGELVTFTRPLTEGERRVWQQKTDDIYEVFTSKASEGRGLPIDDLKSVASGRVWSGAQAEARGLVDVLGGYTDAINIAASAAGLADYQVQLYPRQKPFIEQLFSQLGESAETRALRNRLGHHYTYYQQWLKVKEFEGVQARMPFELQIR
jgi:protease-4